ncbi:MAG TPA: alpha/beta fold hydrolase, partial [Kribbellaceae bacterium]
MTDDTSTVADVFADVRDESLTRRDGRVVAWTRTGADDGVPVLRMPGTPGSRWGVRADRTRWTERNLLTIVTERPGFGRSTRLPGRGFAEHADDLAAVLDHLGIDTAYVTGGSGGGPHVLAFCARHPDRVRAATVVAGFAPPVEDEVDQMIELNAKGYRLARAGDEAGLRELLTAPYEEMLADPLGGFAEVMAHAPESDREIMT